VSVLETARLRLRLLRDDDEGDAVLYTDLYSNADVMRHIAAPFSRAAAAEAFSRICRHNHAARPGHRTWRIDERASGTDLGIVALQRSGEAAEIGVVLRREAWGRGIGREALAAVLERAFRTLGLALVYGERPDDAQARRVDRMFIPLGLDRVPAPRPGVARWELSRARWDALRS
jgi:RimJ/RimL family protein N-acetyltransferase